MNTTPKKMPRWVLAATLLGAALAFVAAIMAFAQQGAEAMGFGIGALVMYVAAVIGNAMTPAGAQPREPAPPSGW